MREGGSSRSRSKEKGRWWKAEELGKVGEEPQPVELVLLKKLSNSSLAGTELSRGEERWWRVPVSLSLDLCTWTLILSLDTRKLRPARGGRGHDMMDRGDCQETGIWRDIYTSFCADFIV